jgi:hypothetical protein
MPKAAIPTGTVLRNQASIIFDFNAPILTNEWLNTLDADDPVSAVQPLAKTQRAHDFPVRWGGADIGSGVRDFTVFVSDNGGPWTPWLVNAPATEGLFTGVGGHTYAFYSAARDNAGNLEAAPPVPDAVTLVTAPSIVGIAPTSAPRGQTLNVVIDGGPFQSAATVAFSGKGITVNNVVVPKATQLTANISIAANAASGPRDVTVTNPDTTSDTAPGAFIVLSTPSVASVNPPVGEQGQTLDVTINGGDFLVGAIPTFGGSGITVNSASVISETTLVAGITIANTAPAGARSVTVTNPDGQSTTTPGLFTVQEVGLTPGITSVSPTFGAPGTASPFTINGSSFQAGASVSFGEGITVGGLSVASSQITGNLSISSGAAPGLRDVQVTNPGGLSAIKTAAFAVGALPARGKIAAKASKFPITPPGKTGNGKLRVWNKGRGQLVFAVEGTTGPFTVTGSPGPYVLPARGSVEIPMVFAPTSTGRKTGTVALRSDDPRKPQLNVRLRGTSR